MEHPDLKGAVPIILLACDLMPGGEEIGPESKRRAGKAIERLRTLQERGRQSVIVVSAGPSPDIRKYPAKKTMALLTYSYLKREGVEPEKMLIGQPVWGTRAEIQEAIRLIETKNLCSLEVEIVSSRYHLCRLDLLWHILIGDRDGWEYSHHLVPGGILNALIEVPKFFRMLAMESMERI